MKLSPTSLLSLLLAVAALQAAGSLAFAAERDPYDRSNVPIEQQPADPKAVKIVLLAGDAGTGHGPGEHEHFAGCAMFLRMLQQTAGVAPVLVQDGWPKDPKKTFENAKAVVFYMDGAGKQTSVLHEERMDKLAAAGVGLVHIHQCIDYPHENVARAVQWLGAVYDPKTGARGHWDATFDHFPSHPVTRGVTPFTMNDGYIDQLTWVEGLKGVTPLLRTKNPKAKAGAYANPSDDIFCWAYDRPGGGRSFVLTGGHDHKNWQLDGLRKLTVNGILWSAGVEIPPDGAPCRLDPADLMQNMDRKPPKKPAAPKASASKTPSVKTSSKKPAE